MRIINTLTLFFCIAFSTFTNAQPANKSVKLPKPNLPVDIWVDSVYNKLSLDEKIGQLFMIAAYSGGEKYNRSTIERLITQNKIGGLIFMQGTAEAQGEQTNAFQQLSKVPLLIGMDAEWGLGMRLKNVDDMPRQIMMGAMRDTSLVYKMAKAVAYQCRRLGVHIDFAPVVDINNNPNNPVINFRSFGENKYNVARYAMRYVEGLQDNGVIASAKHFPGHGNTDVDSHKDLPTISSSATALDNLELYPFKEMINKGVGSIMIAHLQIPALDNTPNTPTTLSKKVVTDLLKTKLNYKGLIITDALNMAGVAKHFKPGDVDLKAFEAGNDVLLFSQDVATGVTKIKDAIQNGKISSARLEESVKKILKAKFFVGLNKFKPINITNITNDLNQYTSALRTDIAKEAITILTDQNGNINAISSKQVKKIAYVGIGSNGSNPFSKALERKGIFEHYFGGNTGLVSKLNNHDVVIVGIHSIALYPGKNFGISTEDAELVNQLLKNKNALLIVFGNPYALKYFCTAKSAVVAYDEKPETQQVMADILTGDLKAHGKLPVSVCPTFKAGMGIVNNEKNNTNLKPTNYKQTPQTNDAQRTATVDDRTVPMPSALNNINLDKGDALPSAHISNLPVMLECCVNPASVGANVEKLAKIDELIRSGMDKKAYPGCRVLVAKNGKVFYDKSFGYTTPEKTIRVTENTVYDIASVTKVMATTLAAMKLYEKGKLDLTKTLGDYLPMTKGTNKSNIKIRDIMLHQSGMKSWIAFYKETLDSNKVPRKDIYNYAKKAPYTIPVCNNLYMTKNWVDTMWDRILSSPVGDRTYEYSDLNFIFLQKVIEKITGQSLDQFVTKEFYNPLHLKNTNFNPLNKNVSLKQIAPTEKDIYFRYQTVQGYVHDMASAMFGGVSGHAGLFSTAEDLSVIMQLLLNGGIYDGKRLLEKRTIDLFSTYQSNNSRRGYGWDKPERKGKKNNNTAENCSSLTFGHTGFTGTCVWADPVNNLQFIFLSNRTYPSAETNLLSKLDIRTKAQQIVYDSLGL